MAVGIAGVEIANVAPAPLIVIPSPFANDVYVPPAKVTAVVDTPTLIVAFAVGPAVPPIGVILVYAEISVNGIGPLKRLLFVQLLSSARAGHD